MLQFEHQLNLFWFGGQGVGQQDQKLTHQQFVFEQPLKQDLWKQHQHFVEPSGQQCLRNHSHF